MSEAKALRLCIRLSLAAFAVSGLYVLLLLFAKQAYLAP